MSRDPNPLPRSPRRPGRPAGGHSGEGREALLEAATSLMAERGLPRVTAREVAKRAHVQPALVNYYFGGKDALLRAVVERVAERMLRRVEAAAAGDGPPEERLRAVVHGMIAGMSEDPYAPRLLVEQVLFGSADVIDAFVEQFASRQFVALDGLLADGKRAGLFRDVDSRFLAPQLIGGAIFFFLSHPVQQRLFDLDEITPERARRYADHLVDVLLLGIRAPVESEA